jgi:hypothetical protein
LEEHIVKKEGKKMKGGSFLPVSNFISISRVSFLMAEIVIEYFWMGN